MTIKSAPHNSSLDALSDNFSQQAGTLRSLIEDIADSVPEAAKEKLEALKAEVASFCERGKDRAGNLVGKVTDTIKSHPLESAAAAVGAGLLTWWLLNRRH